MFSEISSELFRLGRECTEGVAVGDKLKALVYALSHGLLHLIDVPLHVLYDVPTLLIFLLQGEQLSLILIALIGGVLQLLS